MDKSVQFGLITYSNTGNLGDEIQSIAVRELLPQVSALIDREKLGAFSNSGQPVALVIHGWFCHRPESWPPSFAINPLLIGLHISPAPSKSFGILPQDAMLSDPAIKYLVGYSPVGARDQSTLELLSSHGIDSYFSGCVSLTYSTKHSIRDPDLVVVNDVNEGLFEHIKSITRKNVVFTTHNCHKHDVTERFREADELLNLYATASCVITTRLHCALPCVAMEVPVLVLDREQDCRFSGLNNLFYTSTTTGFMQETSGFDVTRPPAAKKEHYPLRDLIHENIRDFIKNSLKGMIRRYPLSSEDSSLIVTQNLLKLYQRQWPD